jgi:hypothetical protein
MHKPITVKSQDTQPLSDGRHPPRMLDFPVYHLRGLAETLRQMLAEGQPLERSEQLWLMLDLVAAVREAVDDAKRFGGRR